MMVVSVVFLFINQNGGSIVDLEEDVKIAVIQYLKMETPAIFGVISFIV